MAKKTELNKTLVNKTSKELYTLLKDARNQWLKLKLDLKVNKLKNVHEVKIKRKEIALIQTLIRQKEYSGISD